MAGAPMGCSRWSHALIPPLALSDLRRRAREARETSGRTLGDMLMTVAVMTDSRGLQLDDAVRVMSRCARGMTRCRIFSTAVVSSGWRERPIARLPKSIG